MDIKIIVYSRTMKIIVKNLKKDEIEINFTDKKYTIIDLKNDICKSINESLSNVDMKIVYNGDVLSDNLSVIGAGLENKTVIYIKKPKSKKSQAENQTRKKNIFDNPTDDATQNNNEQTNLPTNAQIDIKTVANSVLQLSAEMVLNNPEMLQHLLAVIPHFRHITVNENFLNSLRNEIRSVTRSEIPNTNNVNFQIEQVDDNELRNFSDESDGENGEGDDDDDIDYPNDDNGNSVLSSLTDEELNEIESISEMGFDRLEVLQTYIACGKNIDATLANLFG